MVMFTCIYYTHKQFTRPFTSLHHRGHMSLHVPVLRPASCTVQCAAPKTGMCHLVLHWLMEPQAVMYYYSLSVGIHGLILQLCIC